MTARAAVSFLVMVHWVALAAAAELRLSGIVSCGRTNLAVLEQGQDKYGHANFAILRVGQSDAFPEKVDLLDLKPEQHSATVRINGTNLTLVIRSNPPMSGIVLQEAATDATIDLYGRLAQRTVLRHPFLPDTTFTFLSGSLSEPTPANVVNGLEAALRRAGMISIPGGKKFILLVPEAEQENARTLWLAEGESVENDTVPSTANKNTDIEPPGFINFPHTHLNQAAVIYAELLGKKLDRQSFPLTQGTIYLKTNTPLTREEALFAFKTHFAWHKLELVPAQDGMVRLRQF